MVKKRKMIYDNQIYTEFDFENDSFLYGIKKRAINIIDGIKRGQKLSKIKKKRKLLAKNSAIK